VVGVLAITGSSVGQAVESPEPGAEATPRIGVFFWHDSPNDEAAFTAA
jgi:hypothetical protein